MAVDNKFETATVVAGQDLSGAAALYKAITVGGTIAATSATAFGLLRNRPASGQHAAIGYKGQMKAYAGAAINSGSGLAVTTSGFITAAGSVGESIGKALISAASGDLFTALFDFTSA